MAVGRGAHDGLGSDRAAGAYAVFHDHLLSDALAELMREDTAGHVGAAAGAERHDHADGLRREGLRNRVACKEDEHHGNHSRSHSFLRYSTYPHTFSAVAA
jgi:hypothetical protein